MIPGLNHISYFTVLTSKTSVCSVVTKLYGHQNKKRSQNSTDVNSNWEKGTMGSSNPESSAPSALIEVRIFSTPRNTGFSSSVSLSDLSRALLSYYESLLIYLCWIIWWFGNYGTTMLANGNNKNITHLIETNDWTNVTKLLQFTWVTEMIFQCFWSTIRGKKSFAVKRSTSISQNFAVKVCNFVTNNLNFGATSHIAEKIKWTARCYCTSATGQ